jgi:hypothetical protein
MEDILTCFGTLSRESSLDPDLRYVSPIRLLVIFSLTLWQAKLPSVTLTLPPDKLLIVEKLDSIPNYLRDIVDSMISQLDRSVMLEVCGVPHPL